MEEKENLEQQREELKKQSEEYLNGWKRAQADFANYKKDEEKKVLELWVFRSGILAAMDTIRDLLTGVYNNQDKSNIHEFIGIKHLQDSIERAWEQVGIRKIAVEGQTFDPKIHEALLHEEDGEKLEEIAPGYAIGDKIIKPARVKILKK